ncbi:hypothetical protein FGO68_gene71 [Halteria grandinella]|uniref:Spt4/RpoE2 zinc finger domain-containing protein n=1 Tax=Halteria grandinella TaxID=5974 RepID=A0A8J8SYI8_HALGN|nr:hypothetical protein FGO68_gene71 [Halteria grandinella]
MGLTQAVLPNAYKKLRACRECRLIKSEEQFLKDGGCENCPNYEVSDLESLEEYTSANFEGMISVIIQGQSWVAKYNNLRDVVPGCYAVCIRSERWLQDEGKKEGESEDEEMSEEPSMMKRPNIQSAIAGKIKSEQHQSSITQKVSKKEY